MTLEALASQKSAPEQIAVFDWSGADNQAAIAEIWDAAAPAGVDVTVELNYFSARGPNLGSVVRNGLAQWGAEPSERNWLWILHDDSPPEPAALAALRNSIELSPSVAVAGCKQVGLTGSPLLSVGYTTSRFGRRLTGIEDGEVDQGQHDHRDDVLAVGTAGMLIRSDVWHDLGGPDRALGPFMDGQDLSRRARLAGHRTIVVSEAVVRHYRASFALRRASEAEHSHSHNRRAAFFRRRQEFIHFQLVAAPLPLVPFLLLIALGAGFLRALGRIVLKEPRMISAELRAPLSIWAAPVSLMRGRAQARRSRRLPRRVLRPLQATWREVYALERDRRQHRAASRRALVIRDELDIAERAARAARRRGWLTLTLVAAGALTLTILGSLITAGQLIGGALAPSQASLAALWQAATNQYVATGFGQDLPANPLLLVLLLPTALGATIGLNLGAVITAIFILALPVAALNAWAAAGALTRSPAVRAWVAIAWTVAPALQFALGEGRLGALLAHVFLPLVVLGAIRGAGAAATDTVEQRRPEGSGAAAAGGALALAIVVGAAPAPLPAALVRCVVAAIFAGRKWLRMLRLRGLWRGWGRRGGHGGPAPPRRFRRCRGRGSPRARHRRWRGPGPAPRRAGAVRGCRHLRGPQMAAHAAHARACPGSSRTVPNLCAHQPGRPGSRSRAAPGRRRRLRGQFRMGAPGRAGVANVARIPRGKPGRALAGRKYRAVAAPRPGRHHRVVSGFGPHASRPPGPHRPICLAACGAGSVHGDRAKPHHLDR